MRLLWFMFITGEFAFSCPSKPTCRVSRTLSTRKSQRVYTDHRSFCTARGSPFLLRRRHRTSLSFFQHQAWHLCFLLHLFEYQIFCILLRHLQRTHSCYFASNFIYTSRVCRSYRLNLKETCIVVRELLRNKHSHRPILISIPEFNFLCSSTLFAESGPASAFLDVTASTKWHLRITLDLRQARLKNNLIAMPHPVARLASNRH